LSLFDSAIGESGFPDIPDTILRRLSTSDIVVFDLTPVATTDVGTRKSKQIVNFSDNDLQYIITYYKNKLKEFS
jgi:hypothetical protein